MAYIEKTDLNRVFPSESRLDLITNSGSGADDTIWQDAAGAAIADMEGALSGRFDTDNIFSQTGDARKVGSHAIVLQYTLTLTMWFIYQKVSPDKIPDAIMQEVERIRLWQKGVNKFEINPKLPTLTKPQQDQILFGSDTKRNNPSL